MSDASKKCPHDLAEAEAAVFADGLCPLCLKADLAAAREKIANAKLENSLKIRDEHIENLEDQLDKGDN